MTRPYVMRRALLTLIPGATLSAPALANPTLGGGEDLNVSLWRVVIALLVAVVLIVLTALLIRQRGGKVDPAVILGRVRLRHREIDVVETRRLSPHADISLVRYRQCEYLLLLGASNSRVLSSVAGEAAGEDGPEA